MSTLEAQKKMDFFHMEPSADLPRAHSDSTSHPDNQSINRSTLDTAEAMQVQHVPTGEKESTDQLRLKPPPDPRQHTRDSTPHAADFSLPTVSEPSCSYQHTTTGRKYAVKHAISESCKHSGRAEGKQRQFRFFQTVNHAKVIWDSKTKPKGIVGGHLNIQNKIRFNAY